MEVQIKNAFVLGAGLGTRLKTLTQQRPKPLIPVCNKPLITYAFDHLAGMGVKRFVVNTHHRPEAYGKTFPEKNYQGSPVEFRHEPVLLDTGGGIKNVEDLLGDGGPFFVYNGDILSDLPLEKAVAHHFQSGNEVTMVLRSSGGPLAVALDEGSSRILDIGDRLLPSYEGKKCLFTGIYLVNPSFFGRIPANEVISVIPIFLDMIRRGEPLGGIVIDDGHWWDLGTREQYLAVHRHFAAASAAPWIDPTARVAPSASLSPSTAIGANSTAGEGASLKDCIVWEDAEIASGASLESCIITSGRRVEGTHAGSDF